MTPMVMLGIGTAMVAVGWGLFVWGALRQQRRWRSILDVLQRKP